MYKCLVFLLLISTDFCFGSSRAFALSLNEYLGQVQEKNSGIQSGIENMAAAELKEETARLIFAPALIANAQVVRDYAEMSPPLLTYDHIDTKNYSFGVAEQFGFGLKAKLSYVVDYTSFVGAGFPPGSPTLYYDAKPILEVSLPLWQNCFGRSARANRDLLVAQARAQRFSADAGNQALALQSEVTYWRLASARQVRQIQLQALKQAQAILDYVSRKARMHLGESADELQAKALVEARRFELKQAENEEAGASRAFNALRFVAEEAVPEALDPIETESVLSLQTPSGRPGDRADVLVVEAQADLSRSNSVVEIENNRPVLDLFGRYSFTGRDADMQESMSRSFSDHRDTSAVGVRFSMPLDLAATRAGRRAGEKAMLAAELKLQENRFKQDRDWQDLVQRIGEAKLSLKYANNIETAQRLKLENEKERYKHGRTTTYQVLLFEQDFSQAELIKARATLQILSLLAQVKLYSADKK